MRLAILCPGQGAQHGAMFDLAETSPKGAAWLAQCQLDQVLGTPLPELLARPQALFANLHAQPLLVAAQLAAWQALAEEVVAIAGAPAVVAGYSVGELSACAIAGVFAAHATVRLAARRAACMDAAAAAQPGQGLMSVSGLAVDLIAACLRRHGAWVAIFTGDDSLIGGGSHGALQAAQAELGTIGARSGMLPVGLASHTPLMQGAVDCLAQALAGMAAQAPRWTLLSGVNAQPVAGAAQVQARLQRQLCEPIQWSGCMDACAERGVTVALELGPGSALSGMLRQRHGHIACRSLADFRSLGGALEWLRRQAD